MLNHGAVELVDNELFLLGGVEPIDGRLSHYPDATIGKFAPYNCYLLRSGNEDLLIESGVASHHSIISSQLRELLRGRDGLKRMAVTRVEPECNCNIPNLVKDFGVEAVHSLSGMSVLQYFPVTARELRAASFDALSTELQMMDFGVQCIPLVDGEVISVGGKDRLEPFRSPLRVLPTMWFYDPPTRTLFCSDMFGGHVSDTPSTRTNSEVLSEDRMLAGMLEDLKLKFGWLSQGYLTGMADTLEAYFLRRKIEILAPTRGNVVVGAEAVEANWRALVSALRTLDVGGKSKRNDVFVAV